VLKKRQVKNAEKRNPKQNHNNRMRRTQKKKGEKIKVAGKSEPMHMTIWSASTRKVGQSLLENCAIASGEMGLCMWM